MLTLIIILVTIVGYLIAGQVIAKVLSGTAAKIAITQESDQVEYEWENNLTDKETRWLTGRWKPSPRKIRGVGEEQWVKTGRTRGGEAILDVHAFTRYMNGLRFLWPIYFLTVVSKSQNAALIGQYDPKAVAAREAEHQKELETLRDNTRLSEMADTHFRETGEVLDKEFFRDTLR